MALPPDRLVFSDTCGVTVALAHFAHEATRVVAFVGAQRYALLTFDPLGHFDGGVALGRAARHHHGGVDYQSVAIFDQYIAAIALAAASALPEVGRTAPEAPGRHSELLSHQRTYISGGFLNTFLVVDIYRSKTLGASNGVNKVAGMVLSG